MVLMGTSLSYLMMFLFTGMPGMSWITTSRPGVHLFAFTAKLLCFYQILHIASKCVTLITNL